VAVLLTLFLSHTQEDVAKRIVIEIAAPNDEIEMVTDSLPDELAIAIVNHDTSDTSWEMPITTGMESAHAVSVDAPQLAYESTGFEPGMEELFGRFDALAGAGGTQAFGLESLGGEIGRRLSAAGAESGYMQISLSWNDTNDIDLHVHTPTGEKIWWQKRESRSGGRLDVDANSSNVTNEPVENVFWPARRVSNGTFRVFVHHYSMRANASTSYEVWVRVGRVAKRFEGTISRGKRELVTAFRERDFFEE